jgi:hypothetical protein
MRNKSVMVYFSALFQNLSGETEGTEQSPSWDADSHSYSLKIPRLLWWGLPDGSLPWSQEPNIGPHSEPD